MREIVIEKNEAGSYHYIVSDEEGVKEVDKSQVLLAENSGGNLSESRNGFSGCLTDLTEETEEDSVRPGSVRKVMNTVRSKDNKKSSVISMAWMLSRYLQISRIAHH